MNCSERERGAQVLLSDGSNLCYIYTLIIIIKEREVTCDDGMRWAGAGASGEDLVGDGPAQDYGPIGGYG